MRQKENNGKSKSKTKAAAPVKGSGDASMSRLPPLGGPASAAGAAADKIGRVSGKGGGKAKGRK